MKKKTILLTGVLLVPVVTLGLAVGAARMSHGAVVELGLEGGRLRPCPPTPNCVCSETENETASIAALDFECAPEVAFRSLIDWLRTESSAEIVTATDDYVHVVYTTPLLRFADDVELRLDAEASVIHVRSASRIGHSDLETNRARIEDLRRRWAPAPEAP